MALKKTAMFAAVVGASVMVLTACGSDQGVIAAGGVPPQDMAFVEASLTDGTFLTCSEVTASTWGLGSNGYKILDCDWRSQRTEHNPDLQTIGPLQIVQKRFQNGKSYNCLSFEVSVKFTAENCDWDRPLEN